MQTIICIDLQYIELINSGLNSYTHLFTAERDLASVIHGAQTGRHESERNLQRRVRSHFNRLFVVALEFEVVRVGEQWDKTQGFVGRVGQCDVLRDVAGKYKN